MSAQAAQQAVTTTQGAADERGGCVQVTSRSGSGLCDAPNPTVVLPEEEQQLDAPVSTRLEDTPPTWMQQLVGSLRARSKVALFQTCRGLAHAVATHAPSMRFKPGQHSTPAGHALNTSLMTQSHHLHLWLIHPSSVQNYGQQPWHRLTMHSRLCTDGSVWQELNQEKLKQVTTLRLTTASTCSCWTDDEWQQDRFAACRNLTHASQCTVGIVCMHKIQQGIKALPKALKQQIKMVIYPSQNPELRAYITDLQMVIGSYMVTSRW